jgi:hypothetical protein
MPIRLDLSIAQTRFDFQEVRAWLTSDDTNSVNKLRNHDYSGELLIYLLPIASRQPNPAKRWFMEDALERIKFYRPAVPIIFEKIISEVFLRAMECQLTGMAWVLWKTKKVQLSLKQAYRVLLNIGFEVGSEKLYASMRKKYKEEINNPVNLKNHDMLLIANAITLIDKIRSLSEGDRLNYLLNFSDREYLFELLAKSNSFLFYLINCYTIDENHVQFVEVIYALVHRDASLIAVNKEGDTPWHVAIKNPAAWKVLPHFLQFDASALMLYNNNKETPLDIIEKRLANEKNEDRKGSLLAIVETISRKNQLSKARMTAELKKVDRLEYKLKQILSPQPTASLVQFTVPSWLPALPVSSDNAGSSPETNNNTVTSSSSTPRL